PHRCRSEAGLVPRHRRRGRRSDRRDHRSCRAGGAGGQRACGAEGAEPAGLRAAAALRRCRPRWAVPAGRRHAAPGARGMTAAVPRLDVDHALDTARIIVCCGSGGVGKTTTAAALGLRAAERGRSVVVLTIDPARRLAQSMGPTELDNTPREVKGVDESGGGRLDAMMLDMKRTFDEIVVAHSTPDRAKKILENPFYQSLSS